MPILGIGTDIAEIARFESPRMSERFARFVFTDSERSYCLSKAKPSQHFAARFAAKEATAKALCAVFPFVSVCQVEVLRSDAAPSLRLIKGRHGEPAPDLPPGVKLHVSISHSDHYAVATVIVEHDSMR